MSSRLPDRITVISDLHLGEGLAPVRGAAPLESFFYDREFRLLVDRLMSRAGRRGHRLELVLNGDAFDFARALRLPETPADVFEWRRLLHEAQVACPPAELARAIERRYSSRERRYGYGTDEPGCVWKLWVIARAHRPVIRALASWCRAGHSLVVVRGNHDPEWAWPGVQRAFLILLRRAGSGPLAPGRVRFRSRVYRRANVHIEHGHRLDWHAVARREFLPGKPPRLHLPYGSLVGRYLITALERAFGADPRTPPAQRLEQLARRRPWRVLPLFLIYAARATPLIGAAGWKVWFGRFARWAPAQLSATVAMAALVRPALPHEGGLVLTLSAVASRLVTAALLFALAATAFIVSQLACQVNRPAAAAAARRYAWKVARRRSRIAAATPLYVILGHTHRPDAHRWLGRSVVYLNPGAWPPRDRAPGRDRAPRLVWLAREGDAYVRHRLVALPAEAA